MKPWLEELSPEVRAELARPVQTHDPRDAQIVADRSPKWHLLEVHEPAQQDVAKELVKRRFGIFVPEKRETIVSRGRKVERRQWLFPGYVFVFVWSIEQHWDRIARIVGVTQIVCSQPDLMGHQAKTVPGAKPCAVLTERSALTIDDEVIDYIRAIENGAQPMRKRRTRGKRVHDDDVIATYPASAFPDRLWMLDFEQRNQTLRKALGLS
ncbi:transcriptional antiterminator NusG [Bradyrhizobium brasilense]|uniref:Transcriptional antiterminator NusG n=1 Tax=Bradyrhizobium brasilense TaxID=1419277 RepID=A0A1G6ILB3_9BRAD|nr:transcription termination/antitermination NusG family protein [Bradyrhizobium brasilense]SDC07243.1 transcriptional antiterminator NusG [Bradyrhizobium brasilense]